MGGSWQTQDGLKIKAQRIKSKLTQQQVADLLGMNKDSYHYIEKGNRRLSLRNALQLTQVFNCTLYDLIDWEAI